jgi:mono/diheme cytochrome c family protein
VRRVLAIIAGLVVLGIVVAAAIAFWPAGAARAVPSQTATPQLIARGEYLATAADCAACHTVERGRPYAGGRAFRLPFGTIYSPNITPDRQTGIGAWTDAEFVRAVRDGVGRDGEQLYPALPYTSYHRMSDADAVAIRAYLQTVPVARFEAPANQLSFPFNQRPLLRFWKILFMPRRGFEPDASKPADWNRGAYLVTALGHCGECHTPRNVFMATKDSKALAGGTAEGWTAYNITSDQVSGLGGWKDEEIVAYLKTGIAHGKAWANGPMGEAVDDSLKYLNDADLKAIVAYLRTVPAVRGDESKPRYGWSADGRLDEASDSEGARLYTFYCSGCHGADGKTHNEYYPAMVGQGTVGANPPTNLIMIILHGARRADHPYAFMPSYRDAFNDEQVAALVNYVAKRFGDPKASIKAGDVADARKQP